MSTDHTLAEPFRRLMAEICTPQVIRRTGSVSEGALWDLIEDSGFVDALLPESRGGVGLSLPDVFPLIAATGEYLLPLPFAETMVARALLAGQDASIPERATITLCYSPSALPAESDASYAIVQDGGRWNLVSLRQGNIGCHADFSVCAGKLDLLVVAAALSAARMSGMMNRLMDMCLSYANGRAQFGRTLGKFQVVQHNLALMAQQVASANVAARIGMSSIDFDQNRVAVAKIRASEAAQLVSSQAHALHGAIGMTHELDLHLYTHQLQQLRMACGSERYWAENLGKEYLSQARGGCIDFVRDALQEVD